MADIVYKEAFGFILHQGISTIHCTVGIEKRSPFGVLYMYHNI